MANSYCSKPLQHSLPVLSLAILAICGPALLARNISPSATYFNQAVSLAGWGMFLVCVAIGLRGLARRDVSRSWPALAALGIMAFGAVMSSWWARLPSALMLSAVGLLIAASLALLVATASARQTTGQLAFRAFAVALLAAGLLSMVPAVAQVFFPEVMDGNWIAHVGSQGRAGGNLRQPNHLSSLMLWSIAALIWLHDTSVEKRAPTAAVRAVAAIGLVALLFGDVLTVSRTGTVCVLLLALWGVLDKQLSRYSRLLLWLAPVIYALCWLAMSQWHGANGADGFAGNTQLHKSDPSSSRFGIWANTLVLIQHNPWFGVGWGEFNFAWTLTPFPGRPVAFFDHTHNLPLNLLVELGIPLGTLVLALLGWAVWKAFVACRITASPAGTMVRTAFVMVLMMVVHSMLEYPLWYAYFLLPTAFALGICLAHSVPERDAPAETVVASPWPRRVLVGASVALVMGTVASVVDYMRVSAIFVADEDDPTPLSQRITQGQKSWFFAHHADYAAATVANHPSTAWKAFRRAPHLLLDTRLMIAWAKAYAEKGDVERARYLVERLREFHNADAAEFFAECEKPVPEGMPKPFQCTPPTRSFTYEDFKLR